MPPALVAVAAIASAAILPSTAVVFGIGLNVLVAGAITIGGGLIGGAASKKNGGQSINEQQQTVQSANAPRSLVYGRKRIGGTSIFLHTTNQNNYLHLMIALAGHEIDGVEQIQFDDQFIELIEPNNNTTISKLDSAYSDWEEFGMLEIAGPSEIADEVNHDIAYIGLGREDQAYNPVISGLIGNNEIDNPVWTSNHRLRGIPYIYLNLNIWFYPQGLPKISFVARGKKIYDPRRDGTVAGGSGAHRQGDSSTWEYSANAALVVADYLTDQKIGIAVDWTDIDIEQLISAANTCDEIVFTTLTGNGWIRAGNFLYKQSHGLRTGLTGSFTTTGALPAGLSTGITYIVHRVDDDYVSLFDTSAKQFIELSSDGSGTHTFTTFEPRYEINGVINSDRSPREVLEEMTNAMAGEVIYTGGKFFILPGTYSSPEHSIDESNLRGEINVITAVSRKDRYNGVKGVYAEPGNRYQPVDFPPIASDTFAFQDGLDDGDQISSGILEVGKGYRIDSVDGGADFTTVGAAENTPGIVFRASATIPSWGTGGLLTPKKHERIWLDLEFPLTTSITACQRISKIGLLRSRQEIVVKLPLNLSGLKFRAGDFFNLSIDRMGWDNKLFKVEDWQLSPIQDSQSNPGLGVDIIAREAAASDYDWSTSEEQQVDPAPDTELPSARTLAAPTGLSVTSGTSELIEKGDGTFISRAKLTWTAVDDGFFNTAGRYESQYKKSSSSTWLNGPPADPSATQLWIVELDDGETYDFRIRAVNSIGVVSDWIQVDEHSVVGKTAPPAIPTNLAIDVDWDRALVRVQWDEVTDRDLSHYELAITDIDSGTTNILDKTRNSPYIWIDNFAPQPEDKSIKIRSVDSSGNSSAWTSSVSFKTPGNNQYLLEVDYTVVPNSPPTVQIDYNFNFKPTDLTRIDIYKGTGLYQKFEDCTFLGQITTFPLDYGSVADLSTDLSANSYTYWLLVVTSSWSREYKLYVPQQ